MNSVLTKLIQELVHVINQTREAQAVAQETAMRIRHEEIPEIYTQEDPQNLEEIYEGYQLQSYIQQLQATNQDALDLINEITGLVLFIKSRVNAIQAAQKSQDQEIIDSYEVQLQELRNRCASLRVNKQNIIRSLQQKQVVLSRLAQGPQKPA